MRAIGGAPPVLSVPLEGRCPLPSNPSPEPMRTLTPRHLDELGDTEHTRGDKALLEVGGVWNRERVGVSGHRLSQANFPP
jgi:hypothetical protein